MAADVRVQKETFDAGAELSRFLAHNPGAGGVASFVGQMRDFRGLKRESGQPLSGMTLEHYAGMTEKAIAEIIEQAKARWKIFDVLVVHRIGQLKPLDQIVLVVVSSAHRGDAFAACEFVMDYLKTQAPFWKKEQTPEGARWVESRASDDIAAERWRRKG